MNYWHYCEKELSSWYVCISYANHQTMRHYDHDMSDRTLY